MGELNSAAGCRRRGGSFRLSVWQRCALSDGATASGETWVDWILWEEGKPFPRGRPTVGF